MPTTSTLSLGTRQDAKYWSQECSGQLSYASTVKITEAAPPLADIKKFFASSDEWLFLAGHFTSVDHLYNEGGTIKIRFKADRVVVTHSGADTNLMKGTDFKQHGKVKAIFWGGCDVHNHKSIVDDLRTLFGNPLMIGWRGTTGWEVLNAVMGGFGNTPPNPAKDFFDRVKSNPASETTVRTAWLDAADATQWGQAPSQPPYRERFSVIGSDGTEYKLPALSSSPPVA